MDKYTKKYIRLIKKCQNDEELSDIIDKIYTDGYDDAEEVFTSVQEEDKET